MTVAEPLSNNKNDVEAAVAEGEEPAAAGDDATPPPAKPQLSKILQLAKPERPALALAFVLHTLSELAGLVQPMVLARAYDAVVAAHGADDADADADTDADADAGTGEWGVRDLWAAPGSRDLGVRSSLTRTLAPHDCAMLVLSPTS